MTYYGAKDLARSFRTVRGNTIKIAEEIPEQHYAFRATPETRTVAQTLVHIAVGTRFQEHVNLTRRLPTLEGFDFAAFGAKQADEEKVARTKNQIVEMLRKEGEKFAKAVEGLSDEFLAERVEGMRFSDPPNKTRFEMLLGPKEHEMHHRAQLMVMQRMLGMTPHLTRVMQERMNAAKTGAAGTTTR